MRLPTNQTKVFVKFNLYTVLHFKLIINSHIIFIHLSQNVPALSNSRDISTYHIQVSLHFCKSMSHHRICLIAGHRSHPRCKLLWYTYHREENISTCIWRQKTHGYKICADIPVKIPIKL